MTTRTVLFQSLLKLGQPLGNKVDVLCKVFMLCSIMAVND